MSESASHDHGIHEASGPAFNPLEAGGAIGLGVNSLLALGVIPVLLGSLADEHRLSAQAIGLAAMAELLTMGVVTGLAGMVLKPAGLRLIGVLASLALVASDLAVLGASGSTILVLRAAAGAAEGVLLWITVGMIARTVTPERWAGVFFTSSGARPARYSPSSWRVWVMPRFGANGGFAALAGASLLGIAPALDRSQSHFAPLATSPEPGRRAAAEGLDRAGRPAHLHLGQRRGVGLSAVAGASGRAERRCRPHGPVDVTGRPGRRRRRGHRPGRARCAISPSS